MRNLSVLLGSAHLCTSSSVLELDYSSDGCNGPATINSYSDSICTNSGSNSKLFSCNQLASQVTYLFYPCANCECKATDQLSLPTGECTYNSRMIFSCIDPNATYPSLGLGLVPVSCALLLFTVCAGSLLLPAPGDLFLGPVGKRRLM